MRKVPKQQKQLANLETSQVTRMARISQKTIALWQLRGIVNPVEKGRPGRGYSDKYTPMQAVGVALAAKLRQSPRSCSLDYVKQVVHAFSDLKPQQLQHMLATDGGHFVCLTDKGIMLQPARSPEWINVADLFDQIMTIMKLKC